MEGLKRLLQETGIQTLESAPSMDELPDIHTPPQSGVLLILDGAMGVDGALKQISAFTLLYPAGRVVVVRASYDRAGLISLYQAGAHACFQDVATATFLKSLELIMLGEILLPSILLTPISAVEPQTPVSNAANFSPKEERILRSLIQGHTNKVIAKELGVAEPTVKVLVRSLLRKLGASNRTQAAVCEIRRRDLNGSPLNNTVQSSTAAFPPFSDHSVSQISEQSSSLRKHTTSPSAEVTLITERPLKSQAKRIGPSLTNATAESDFIQRQRLLPWATIEEQERREEFVAKMHHLRRLREARDVLQSGSPSSGGLSI